MPPYAVRCYTSGCENLAAYKVAARWSDGVVSELKTYALSCPGCLKAWFQKSRDKQAACRLTTNETLEPPGIYNLQRGTRDQKLERLSQLETELGEPMF